MGRFVERLRLKCEFCKMKGLPNTIRGNYVDGRVAVIYECPMCGYIRHHNTIGMIEYSRRKAQRQQSARTGRERYGRLTTKLDAAAKGHRL